MTNNRYQVTNPRLDQTSMVVKSTAASTSQWALRNVFQVVCRFRSGAGSMPGSFRMLPTHVSEISWPRLAKAPVEFRLGQQLVQLAIKRMTGRRRQRAADQPQIRLLG